MTTFTLTKPSSVGVVPVGTILPWAKNLTGVPSLPAQYLECNGQVVNDSDSLLNGTTLPNLNGSNRFLRGNTTSGGTGGSNKHDHIMYFIAKTNGSGTADSLMDGSTSTRSTTKTNHLPPYYDVVWIIRIK